MHTSGRSIQFTNALVVCVVALLVGVEGIAHDRGLIRTLTPVVDMTLQANGDVRLYTQDFVVYTASKSQDAWRVTMPTFTQDTSVFDVLRVGRVVKTGSTVLIGGNIVLTEGGSPKSAILRSVDDGKTFTAVAISNDTLGTTDDLRLTQDGMVFFLDRVGRLWSSVDNGAQWSMKAMPKPIPLGGARELDMLSKQMGVCIDIGRDIHFTTNAWSSVISPMVSTKPITRTQPSFLDYFAWSRTLTFWQNELIVEEGSDIYRSASNDLYWSLWKGVHAFGIAPDRSSLVYWQRDRTLKQITSFTTPETVIATDVIQPDIIRVQDGVVFTYRPDTGPIVYASSGTYSIRPYTITRNVGEPSMKAVGTKKTPSTMGVTSAVPGAVLVDVLSEVSPGKWKRDTILPVGPIRTARMISKDEMVFGNLGSSYVYNRSTKQLRDYTLESPIAEFLKKPIARFKMRVSADELDSTHVQWTEFRKVGNAFKCAELVDSSQYGVSSDLIDLSVSVSDLNALLTSINERGSAPLDLSALDLNEDVVKRFNEALDTVFAYDAYFDVFDIYRPPPAPEVQAADCRTEFARV